MTHAKYKEAGDILDRAQDLTSKINRLTQDKGAPREISILMQGARDQGVVTISHDQEALPGECIVRQCADLILVDLKAERVGLELRFKEL